MDLNGLAANFATHTPVSEIAFRLVAAAFLGGLIGLDRERRDKPAGLRTHMLVALATATVSVLALELFQDILATPGSDTPDPVRIVEAMAQATAFLGAGAIIRGRGTVHGITTGVTLWLGGMIGMVCGTGHVALGLMTTGLALLILVALRFGERLFDTRDGRDSGSKDGGGD